MFKKKIHCSGVLTALAWLVPHETADVSAQVLCTPYNHAPYQFMQSHIHKVHACLGVTCHLHFWQNGRGLLRDTAVTQGWNGGGTDTEKNILPPLCHALPCRDRSVMALFSPRRTVQRKQSIQLGKSAFSNLTSYKSVKAMLFVHNY